MDIEKEDEKDISPKLEGRNNFEKEVTSTTTTQRTIQPETVDECHLPYYPAVDPELGKAWQFGLNLLRFSKYVPNITEFLESLLILLLLFSFFCRRCKEQ